MPEDGEHPWLTELRGSLSEYLKRVFQRTWTIVVGGASAVLGIISLIVAAPAHGAFLSVRVWASLLIVGLFIAQYLAFNDVRRERSEMQDEIEQRFDSLRYRFQMKGLNGTATTAFVENKTEPETGFDITLIFSNGGLEVLEFEVEHLSLTFDVYGAKGDFASKRTIILPGQEQDFRYPWIPAPIDQPLSGHGEYVINYGHPSGGKWFRTRHEFRIVWHRPQLGGQAMPLPITIGTITHEVIRKSAPEFTNC
jgi:hypothetical protein